MVPPLRERKEDIPVLAHHLIQTLNNELGTKVTRLAPEVLRCFERYPWPGNIRELANILERILYSLDGDRIERHHLPIYLQDMARGPSSSSPASLKNIRDNQEKETLLQVLERSKYNKNKASLVLGIHRTALYKKMKKYQIPLHPF
jgi:transcriptional regulator with PAS, ATPase and Fis domain